LTDMRFIEGKQPMQVAALDAIFVDQEQSHLTRSRKGEGARVTDPSDAHQQHQGRSAHRALSVDAVKYVSSEK
jgi:hypothetical protein